MRDLTKPKAFELTGSLAVLTHKITRDFPKKILYGLAAQVRSAAISLPSDVAEGSDRSKRKEHILFVPFTFSSSKELDKQYSMACKLGNVTPSAVTRVYHFREVDKFLAA